MPLTTTHWHVNGECVGGFQHQRKRCSNAARRNAAQLRRAAREKTQHHSEKPSKRICWLCAGLAHRVSGKRCRKCGLAYRVEPRGELMLRKFSGA
jgi:hypothetical protein